MSAKQVLSASGAYPTHSHSKKLFSQVWELSKQMDRSLLAVRHLGDLFSPENTAARGTLRDKCETLLLTPDLPQRRKVEELLWKKAFYDVIQKCRASRKQLVSAGDGVCQAYQRHLAMVVSFYSELLRKLEAQQGVSITTALTNDVDPDDDNGQWFKAACYRCLVYMGDAARYQTEMGVNTGTPVAYYHHAIALDPTNGTAFNQLAALAGDKNECCDAAYYYWRSLSSPQPFKGVEQNLQRVFDKVQAKMEWLRTPEALKTQEDNMRSFVRKQLLVKFLYLQMLFSPYCKSECDASTLGPLCQEVIEGLEECLNFDLQALKDHTPPAAAEGGATHPGQPPIPLLLPCDVVMKLAAIAILSAHSLRIRGSVNTPAATALALAMFSQLLQYAHQRLALLLLQHCTRRTMAENKAGKKTSAPHQSKSYSASRAKSTKDMKDTLLAEPSMEMSMMEYVSCGEVGKMLGFPHKAASSGGSGHAQVNDKDGPTKMNQKRAKLKAVDRMRRRQRARRAADSEEDEEGSDENSGGEHDADSLDSVSDFEDMGEDDIDLLKALSSSEESAGEEEERDKLSNSTAESNMTISLDLNPNSSPGGRSKRRKNITLAATFSSTGEGGSKGVGASASTPTAKSNCEPEKQEEAAFHQAVLLLCEVVSEEVFLMPVKVFGDWLQAIPVVIATCAQSSSTLWSRLADLLNFIPSEQDLIKSGYENLLENTNTPALVEDDVLRGFAPLVRTQELLDYSTTATAAAHEQAVTRLFYLHRFGQFVAHTKTAPSFNLDESGQRYIGPVQKQRSKEQAVKKEEKEKTKDAKLKQSQLMKAMAQHKLETEVATLRKQKEAQSSPVTPFILPDALTLCNNLHIIKKLIKSEQFIIIVARAVLDMLDGMKKEKGNFAARDAIKFLEREFQQKNRFLRPQAPEETVQPQRKRQPKQDLQIWHLQCLVDCAVHFTQESLEVSLGQCAATLLLDKALTGEQAPEEVRQLTENAQVHAVDVNTPISFFSSWKKTSQQPT